MGREFATKTNAYLLDYIKYADAKAGAILTFAGLVGGGVASTAPKVLADAKLVAPWLGPCAAALVVVVLAGALGVGYCCLRALTPRTSTATSLSSFPDIASMSVDDYVMRMNGVGTDEAAAREYLRHNWTLSQVAQAKFDSISSATQWIRWMLLGGATYGVVAVAIAAFGSPCILKL